ncbi:MAG: hypothetical protein HY553_15820 [Elusimicrobia bacterium]|nr:hypothetical protein [Elusimicrobiota bacterium]
MERKEFLRRLLMGLEDGIERTRMELPYYKPDSLEGHYAKKFLKAMEDQLVAARDELAQLESQEKNEPPPLRPTP